MTIQYNINKYIHGVNGFGLRAGAPAESEIYSATLAVSTNTTVTCPGDAAIGTGSVGQVNYFIAIVTTSAPGVYLSFGATATVPAGATFAQSNSVLVPSNREFARYIPAGTVLNFISASAVSVTVEFRSAPF